MHNAHNNVYFSRSRVVRGTQWKNPSCIHGLIPMKLGLIYETSRRKMEIGGSHTNLMNKGLYIFFDTVWYFWPFLSFLVIFWLFFGLFMMKKLK